MASILLIGACGYIGSVLTGSLRERGHTVAPVDIGRRGNPAGVDARVLDYAHLTRRDLEPHDTVILLAAHASVQEAMEDPHGAFANNVVSFFQLLDKLEGRRLVYASSSSVYTGMKDVLAQETSAWLGVENMYDFTKFVDDGLAALTDDPCYGLRFGTVNGSSPNMRPELMLNRMVRMAMEVGHVEISSVHVHRPILAMKDLARAITAIVEGDGPSGAYNLASFNATVLELGTQVGELLGVPVNIGEDRRTYDFSVSTDKFCETYGFEFRETAGSIVEDLTAHFSRDG